MTNRASIVLVCSGMVAMTPLTLYGYIFYRLMTQPQGVMSPAFGARMMAEDDRLFAQLMIWGRVGPVLALLWLTTVLIIYFRRSHRNSPPGFEVIQ